MCAGGHLQPSEEHLADAEVHLKLVKAHLAALVAMEPAGADPPEAVTLPLLEPASGEASAGQGQGDPRGKGNESRCKAQGEVCALGEQVWQ